MLQAACNGRLKTLVVPLNTVYYSVHYVSDALRTIPAKRVHVASPPSFEAREGWKLIPAEFSSPPPFALFHNVYSSGCNGTVNTCETIYSDIVSFRVARCSVATGLQRRDLSRLSFALSFFFPFSSLS